MYANDFRTAIHPPVGRLLLLDATTTELMHSPRRRTLTTIRYRCTYVLSRAIFGFPRSGTFKRQTEHTPLRDCSFDDDLRSCMVDRNGGPFPRIYFEVRETGLQTQTPRLPRILQGQPGATVGGFNNSSRGLELRPAPPPTGSANRRPREEQDGGQPFASSFAFASPSPQKVAYRGGAPWRRVDSRCVGMRQPFHSYHYW